MCMWVCACVCDLVLFLCVRVCVYVCACEVVFLFLSSLPLAWGPPGESLEL